MNPIEWRGTLVDNRPTRLVHKKGIIRENIPVSVADTPVSDKINNHTHEQTRGLDRHLLQPRTEDSQILPSVVILAREQRPLL